MDVKIEKSEKIFNWPQTYQIRRIIDNRIEASGFQNKKEANLFIKKWNLKRRLL